MKIKIKVEKNTITMSLKINYQKLFKNYNKIWKKNEKLMDINFKTKPTKPGDDHKYVKTKIKTYGDNTTTNLYNKKGSKTVPEEKITHKCLSVTSLNSVLYAYKKYHPQIFLEESANMRKEILKLRIILIRN